MTKTVTWVGGPNDGQELTISDDEATYITIHINETPTFIDDTEWPNPTDPVSFHSVICEIKGNKVYYPYDKINKFD